MSFEPPASLIWYSNWETCISLLNIFIFCQVFYSSIFWSLWMIQQTLMCLCLRGMLSHVYDFRTDHWYCIINRCAFSLEKTCPDSQQPLVPDSSFCRVEALCAFPIHISMSHGGILTHLTFRQSCWWNFMVIASVITRRHILIANSLMLWLLQSFHFPSTMIPDALCLKIDLVQFVFL